MRAKRVFHSNMAAYVEYDLREEDSFAADLGIGCKGKIGVLIQILTDKAQSRVGGFILSIKSG